MYFVPVVAIILGVTVRDESVKTLALVGIALVLFGAYLTTRRDPARVTADLPDQPFSVDRSSIE